MDWGKLLIMLGFLFMILGTTYLKRKAAKFNLEQQKDKSQ
ncbi:hypothetical protein SAMN05444392_105117 [Seinonella peptonophila]|uniref:Uncharacterized protein n=1 Tax=Seinonella peptonophila TaxID=112248 RepID=A0A1M4XQP5_9BACL|nr:hypothetical protein SAMN05444392_105117 [Seinonella peptonophila]